MDNFVFSPNDEVRYTGDDAGEQEEPTTETYTVDHDPEARRVTVTGPKGALYPASVEARGVTEKMLPRAAVELARLAQRAFQLVNIVGSESLGPTVPKDLHPALREAFILEAREGQ